MEELEWFVETMVNGVCAGLSYEDLSDGLNCPVEVIRAYERNLLGRIRIFYDKTHGIDERGVGLPLSLIEKTIEVYNLNPKRGRLPKRERIQQIRDLANEGKNKKEISDQTGLAETTISVYANEAGIEVSSEKSKQPKEEPKDVCKKDEDVNGEIFEAFKLGFTQREISELLEVEFNKVMMVLGNSDIYDYF